jgi:hypothetical protein
MPDFVDELQDQAQAAISDMRAAAVAARSAHARAELMRHMRLTATKATALPRGEAVRKVVGEWMAAWHLSEDAYPEVAAEMRTFTDAFCAHAEAPGTESNAAVRQAAAALEAALVRSGTTLADQMAWRSECAHGWWELVSPTPADLPGRTERPGVPRYESGKPFWETGCAPHCREG